MTETNLHKRPQLSISVDDDDSEDSIFTCEGLYGPISRRRRRLAAPLLPIGSRRTRRPVDRFKPSRQQVKIY